MIGYLPQEPELPAGKTVREIAEEGLGEMFALVKQFNAISEKFAEPLDDDAMNKLLEDQGRLQDLIEAKNGWEIERKLEIAADYLVMAAWLMYLKSRLLLPKDEVAEAEPTGEAMAAMTSALRAILPIDALASPLSIWSSVHS